MELVQRTIRLAARRYLWVEGAAQLGLAATISMAGLILLLLLGTNILQWYWPVLLLLAGISFGAFRLRQRALSKYRIAQIVDRKLSLSDSLSTAHYLAENPVSGQEEAVRTQLSQAEELAKTVQVERAFPFQAHRIWAVAGALAAVSFGLVALRYMVTNSLNLHPPLVSVQFTPVVERVERALGIKKDPSHSLLAHDRDQTTRADSAGSEQPEKASLPPQGPGLDNEGAKTGSGDPSQAANQANKGKESSQADARGEKSLSPKGQPGDKAPGQDSPAASPQAGDHPKEQSAKDANGSPGLINRMKDALSSLAAKMQPNSKDQQQGQANSDKSANEKQAGQQQASSSKDQQGNQQDGKGQQSDQNQTAEGQGQGQTAEKAQAAQGHTSDQSPQKGADAHSGVGRQEGDKGIHDAEQLKAMGKLADIIGKRSAQLTGEMTVETASGKQQLKTQYSQKVGQHSDSGGEINRNEVPLVYQRYVREYMEEVRKTDKNNR